MPSFNECCDWLTTIREREIDGVNWSRRMVQNALYDSTGFLLEGEVVEGRLGCLGGDLYSDPIQRAADGLHREGKEGRRDCHQRGVPERVLVAIVDKRNLRDALVTLGDHCTVPTLVISKLGQNRLSDCQIVRHSSFV